MENRQWTRSSVRNTYVAYNVCASIRPEDPQIPRYCRLLRLAAVAGRQILQPLLKLHLVHDAASSAPAPRDLSQTEPSGPPTRIFIRTPQRQPGTITPAFLLPPCRKRARRRALPGSAVQVPELLYIARHCGQTSTTLHMSSSRQTMVGCRRSVSTSSRSEWLAVTVRSCLWR